MGRNIFATFAITLPMAIAFVTPSVRMPVHVCARRGRSTRPAARLMAMSADAMGATSGGAISHTATELQTARTAVSDLRSQLERMESELSRTRAELRTKEALLSRLDGSTAVAAVYVETSQRSLVKALGWRVTAGLVTMFSSLLFTGGNLKIALAIVSSDFISKSFTMFIGERIFNKVKIGKKEGGQKDTMARSIGKALIWRLFAMINTMAASGLLTGSAKAAAQIASFDAVVKTSLMVFYDQMWNKVDWGKELENTAGDGI